MIPSALKHHNTFRFLLHQAMQAGDLFADSERVPSEHARKILKEIQDILHTHLNETFLRSGHVYTPYFSSYEYDELAEIRLLKKKLVETQHYEQASKVRDKEKRELEADWVKSYNAFIRLISWIEEPVHLFVACSYLILHYQDLYVFHLAAIKSELETLCSKKLLLLAYYDLMDMDKPIYELHLKHWQKELQSFINKLILA